jgi:hypothetical protein
MEVHGIDLFLEAKQLLSFPVFEASDAVPALSAVANVTANVQAMRPLPSKICVATSHKKLLHLRDWCKQWQINIPEVG